MRERRLHLEVKVKPRVVVGARQVLASTIAYWGSRSVSKQTENHNTRDRKMRLG